MTGTEELRSEKSQSQDFLKGSFHFLLERDRCAQLWPMLFAVQWCNLTSYRPNRLDYLRRSRQERQELERQEQAAQPYLAEWGVEPDPVPFIDLTRDDAVQVSHSLVLLLFKANQKVLGSIICRSEGFRNKPPTSSYPSCMG